MKVFVSLPMIQTTSFCLFEDIEFLWSHQRNLIDSAFKLFI